ncbi:MAG: ATP-binding protein [Akkermansia sp.]|nr:ATP-binding protein [Akkermansia sp.]
MKKKDVLNLIRSHVEQNDVAFRNAAYVIADDFKANGDMVLSDYINALMSDANAFVPQSYMEQLEFVEPVMVDRKPLFLPNSIHEDIVGLLNALNYNSGIHKILFHGSPGTGKTETAKNLARILKRDLYIVKFSLLIDSKLGQTQKNIVELFDELANMRQPQDVIILFDEIDAIALDRTNSRDIREMGRVTSTILKSLDELNDKVILIATTNLFSCFDRALVRRFDAVIDFDRYEMEDILEIAERICGDYLAREPKLGRNMRLLRKIVNKMSTPLSPAELENAIKVAIGFSNKENKFEYLQKLFNRIVSVESKDYAAMKEMGFTLRDIEILTGDSKSKVGRELK